MINLEDVLILKKGGIHIKKKNRGSFTRWCKGKVTAECIARGKRSKNPKIRKKSNVCIKRQTLKTREWRSPKSTRWNWKSSNSTSIKSSRHRFKSSKSYV